VAPKLQLAKRPPATANPPDNLYTLELHLHRKLAKTCTC